MYEAKFYATGRKSVAKVHSESRLLVTERLAHEGCSRMTLDYDGSVLSTGRHAEGTAVGFNKKKKGAHSYYRKVRRAVMLPED